MLEMFIRASRYFIRSRGHGCTGQAQLAAATYGWGAAGFALRSIGDCYQEHPRR